MYSPSQPAPQASKALCGRLMLLMLFIAVFQANAFSQDRSVTGEPVTIDDLEGLKSVSGLEQDLYSQMDDIRGILVLTR